MSETTTPPQLFKQLEQHAQIAVIGPRPSPSGTSPLPSQAVLQASGLVIVDGGLNWFSPPPKHALILGDADSCAPDQQALFHWRLPVTKDLSDLALAFEVIPKRREAVFLYGFLGGRLDHQLAVLGEAQKFLEEKRPKSFVIDDHVIGLPPGEHTLHHQGPVSVMALNPCELALSGSLDYPLGPTELAPAESRTLSNYARGSYQVRCSRAAFVFIGSSDHQEGQSRQKGQS